MSTPFWQYSQTSLFKEDKLKKSNLAQCVKDWSRDAEEISINGVKFTEVLKAKGLEAENLTADNLKEIWLAMLPQEMDKAQKDKCIDFFAQVLHQGGANYALRGRLADVAAGKGHMVASSSLESSMNFIVKDNQLIVREEVGLKSIILNSGDKEKTKYLPDSEEPDYDPTKKLLTGAGVYSIDLTAEEPAIKCVDLVLNHHHAQTKPIFDTRSILSKIADFFISLVGMNKLADPTATKEDKPPAPSM